MIVADVVQPSPEWHRLRFGVLTASRVGELFTPAKLSPSASREKLLAKLLHEQITGTSSEQFAGNAWTEHGHECEGEAADYLRMVTGIDAQPVGLVYRDETRLAACSPDLWAPAVRTGCEMKNPAGWTHIGWLRAGPVVPRVHVLQVQYSLWITGFERWIWMSYAAPLAGEPWRPGASLPPLIVECEPEPRYQDAFAGHVPAFLAELAAARAELIEMGAVAPGAVE